jgi:hypothetical protein
MRTGKSVRGIAMKTLALAGIAVAGAGGWGPAHGQSGAVVLQTQSGGTAAQQSPTGGAEQATGSALPTFEVASIKLADPSERGH